MIKKLFAFIKTHLGLVYLTLAGFVVVVIIASVLSRPPANTTEIIARYQDAEITLGDTVQQLEAKGYTKIDSTEQNGIVFSSYESKKNKNLPLRVFLKDNTVLEIQHPVTLEESLKIESLRPLFQGENTLDLYFSEEENAKLFVSAQRGLAFKYHEYTGTVSEMWLFQARNIDAFLARHSSLVATQPQETEEDRERQNKSHNYPEFFVKLENATASAQPKPDPATEEFRVPEGAFTQ